MDSVVRRAALAVPNADAAHRWLVTSLVCHVPVERVKKTKARSPPRPVPAGQLDCLGIDALEVHDVLAEGRGQVALTATTAEHERPRSGIGGLGRVLGVGDHVGHGTQLEEFGQ